MRCVNTRKRLCITTYAIYDFYDHTEKNYFFLLVFQADANSFRSHQNMYLRANKNGTVDLAPHYRDFEKWYVIPRYDNKCWLKSIHGQFLRGTPDKKVHLVQHCDEWVEWRLMKMGDSIALESHHNTYLRANNFRVDLAEHCKEWELWNV